MNSTPFLLGILFFSCGNGDDDRVSAFRSDKKTVLATKAGVLLETQAVCFEPDWGWMGSTAAEPDIRAEQIVYRQTYKARQTPGKLTWTESIRSLDKVLTWEVEATADADLPLTYGAFSLSIGKLLQGGVAEVKSAASGQRRMELPLVRAELKQVDAVVFRTAGGQEFELSIAPPLDVHIDGSMRFKLTGDRLGKGQVQRAVFELRASDRISFFHSLAEIEDNSDTRDWFAFTPTDNVKPGILGMQDWLRVGKGRVKERGDQLFVDGKQVRFWGTNIEYSACKPDKARAERAARWFAKQGVNLIRQHKLTNPGWEGLGSSKSAAIYDPADLKRFDYFNHQLRENGIYYAFSPIWDLRVFEGDRNKLVAYEEIVRNGGGKPTTKGLVWFADDVQDLHIATLVNLVGHKNASTGIRYADDPALAYVEIQNEEDAFFFTVSPAVGRHPTYKRLAAAKFSDWLADRYTSEDAIREAWGSGWNTFEDEGGYRNESLKAKNIFPVSNPWLLDNHGKNHPRATRLRDTARFLFECQNRYYQRATQALRDIGYKGMIVGSNWQAGESSGHFLNLASDAQLSFIDRHNYLAGAVGTPGYAMATGYKFENATTLDRPGSALLSTGLQQVSNKPFMLSEWLAIPPHEWAAAETAIIAFYGMGLQGWDLSAFFSSNHDGFTPTLEFPGDKKFNNQTAHGIGLFPLLSRAVLRGDITEAPVVADRRLSIDQAVEHRYDFDHGTIQEHDLKSFTGTPGMDALAIGRVVVSFGEGQQKSRIEDLRRYRKDDSLHSTTGQLQWHASGDRESGFIVVDSDGTQGVFGFSPSKPQKLGQLTITPKNRYSMVMLTAREQDKDLGNCRQALLLAIARVRNTGMKLGMGTILDVGKAPQILEPVQANIQFHRRPKAIVALDADGHPIGQPISIKDGEIELDTGAHKAFYYLVTY